MRVLIYEYTCGGGLAGRPDLAGLRAEGRAMLGAMREDLAKIPGVEVRTLLDRESSNANGERWDYRLVGPGQEEEAFRTEARAADAILVIAPESDGLLTARCRWAEESGGNLLGPSSSAVQLCGDKLALAEWLQGHGIPTPLSQDLGVPAEWQSYSFPGILKPRDGAGSQATFLVRGTGELAAAERQSRAEGWMGEMIVQPFVAGRAVSIAFLMGPRQAVPLLPAEQHFSSDGRFRYLGGTIPLAPDLAARAITLASRAVESVPGLHGYVGVDMVLSESGDFIIEINPRLTTSYLGLRVLAETNLADAMLRVANGQGTGEICWRSGKIRFTKDGDVLMSRSP